MVRAAPPAVPTRQGQALRAPWREVLSPSNDGHGRREPRFAWFAGAGRTTPYHSARIHRALWGGERRVNVVDAL